MKKFESFLHKAVNQDNPGIEVNPGIDISLQNYMKEKVSRHQVVKNSFALPFTFNVKNAFLKTAAVILVVISSFWYGEYRNSGSSIMFTDSTAQILNINALDTTEAIKDSIAVFSF